MTWTVRKSELPFLQEGERPDYCTAVVGWFVCRSGAAPGKFNLAEKVLYAWSEFGLVRRDDRPRARERGRERGTGGKVVELEDGNLQCSRSSLPSFLPSFAAHDKGIKSIPAAEPREKLGLSLHGALPCARNAEEGFNRTSSHSYIKRKRKLFTWTGRGEPSPRE